MPIRPLGFAPLVFALLVGGCAGRAVVMPRTFAMYEQTRTVDAGAACFGQLDRTPLPSFPAGGGAPFSVGVLNWYFPGADPVPCWRRHENRSLGLIKWDLRIAETLLREGRRLERAELAQRFENVSRDYGDFWDGSTLAEVKIVTAPWEARSRRADPSDASVNASFAASPVISRVPFNPDPRDRTPVVDVTTLVREWLDGTRPNFGLVYDSVRFGIGENITRSVVERVFVELRLYFSES